MAAGTRRSSARIHTAVLTLLLSACPAFAVDRDDLDPLLRPSIRLAKPVPASKAADKPIDRICDLIQFNADRNRLPRAWFARLIWKESRFDEQAVSPAGAEGIAQFMPATAKAVGLADAFDMEQAIPASARHLADLKRNLGNLGLASAAYNAGEGRVNRWLNTGGFLPLETEDYVLDIMGEPADSFTDRNHAGMDHALDDKLEFGEACRQLPVIMSRTIPMAHIHTKPWGIQVAGNFRRAAAINQWQRERSRYKILHGYEPVVSRVRSPIGRRGIYAVRIGVDDRITADKICAQLRSAGGACVVMRNR